MKISLFIFLYLLLTKLGRGIVMVTFMNMGKSFLDQRSINYSDTIEPRCRHFRRCGGCQYQHIPYDEQLAQKRAYVSHCFGQSTEPILPSDPHWRYRNKMEFSFSQSRSGEKFLGLMKKKGRVEDLTECHLTSSWFTQTLDVVRNWWLESGLEAYYPPENRGHLRNLTLREGLHTGEKMAVLTVSEEEIHPSHLESFAECFSGIHSLILRKQIIKKKVPTRFEETILKGSAHIHEILRDFDDHTYRFQIKAASFFQPNTFQAETIYQQVMAMANLDSSETVLDLFCGTGALGIYASRYAKSVLGIEIIPEAVQDAESNIALNGIINMQVLAGDVKEKLASLALSSSTIIVDPPRMGLGSSTIQKLLELRAEKILYVSCNPLTQAADCNALGYRIVSLQPIDQFPHTPHVENIALLQRTS